MANTLLTIDQITRKALQILENNLVISRNINRQYDDSFAKSGAKIGNTLRIRKPDRAIVTNGAALNVQDVNDDQVTLTIDNQAQTSFSFTSAEMALSMDDFSARYLEPRMKQMATHIDMAVAKAYEDIFYSVGTPGSTPNSTRVLLQGNKKLTDQGTPLSDRYATVNTEANVELIESMKNFFNPTAQISKQFKTGLMTQGLLGYEEVNQTQNIRIHTNGTRNTAGSIANNAVTGATTLSLTGLGAGATVNKGDVFTVSGVFQVNPMTRESVNALMQFVATQTVIANGGGQALVPIAPAIYPASHPLATVTRLPLAGDVVTFLGAPGLSYPQNLIYHKDAIALATADLILPEGTDMASRQNYNGISMRIIRDYDINNDRLPCRVDVLFGVKAIRPETACRLWG